MQNDPLISLLEDLGLSENESRVYLASVSMGPATVNKIAGASNVKRTTVYPVIESLKKKGLMATDVRKFKHLYYAEKPEKLGNILEERRAKLKKFLPKLESLHRMDEGTGIIGYHEGKEAIKNVYLSLLDDLKPGDGYSVVSQGKKVFDILGWEWFLEFIKKRSKIGADVKVLYADVSWAREHKKLEHDHKIQVKWLLENPEFVANITITPKRVLLHGHDEPMIGIVIENPTTITVFEQMFQVMWNSVP